MARKDKPDAAKNFLHSLENLGKRGVQPKLRTTPLSTPPAEMENPVSQEERFALFDQYCHLMIDAIRIPVSEAVFAEHLGQIEEVLRVPMPEGKRLYWQQQKRRHEKDGVATLNPTQTVEACEGIIRNAQKPNPSGYLSSSLFEDYMAARMALLDAVWEGKDLSEARLGFERALYTPDAPLSMTTGRYAAAKVTHDFMMVANHAKATIMGTDDRGPSL